MALGGNLVSAMSDTERVAEAISKIDLTVQISTKLNRSHLITGREALILPCLGRTERDPAGFVSVENSMGLVHSSEGSLKPASENLLSEPEIISRIGKELYPGGPMDWNLYSDHENTRYLISRCIPGFEDYNTKVRAKEVSTFPMALEMAQSGIPPLEKHISSVMIFPKDHWKMEDLS